MFVNCLQVADMAEDGSIIGKTLQMVYNAGPNKTHPVVLEFTGYHHENGFEYIDYVLSNPNTDDYSFPKDFKFGKREFVESFLFNSEGRREKLKFMRFIDKEYHDWEL